jgi:hypothetical protein
VSAARLTRQELPNASMAWEVLGTRAYTHMESQMLPLWIRRAMFFVYLNLLAMGNYALAQTIKNRFDLVGMNVPTAGR